MAIKSALQFLKEVRIELSKVEWPKFNEWVGSTLVVLFLVCFFAAYLWVVDLSISKLTKYIFTNFGGY